MEPTTHTSEDLIIGTVTGTNLDAAFGFHHAHLGEFMLPLAPTAFRRIVEKDQMLAVERHGEIAGLCYVKPDGKELDTVPRWEFGGLHLSPALRGRGLGTLLSTVAIASVTHSDRKPVMGYVHQDNSAGMGLLVHRLGFAVTDRTIRLGPDDAPGHLRRDSAGFATANVLRLPDAATARLADRLEHLVDGSRGSSPPVRLRLRDVLFPAGLHEAVRRLRT
ncbi:GNAT family N-acetyltransferase [Streptomyces sp. NPDC008313]|uniref:GNAT family N-acetyltransferase n=1 Tax=Streptomyces sp. NPDC008313 TaxID=3364826 RepID=UPI0036DFC478